MTPAPWHHAGVETTRVDRWLWAVRLFKSRAAATEACRGGHVRINGNPAKPAAPVRVGDRVSARAHGLERVLTGRPTKKERRELDRFRSR